MREFVHPIDLVAVFNSALSDMDDFERTETFVVGNSPIEIKDLAQLVINKVGKGNVKYIEQAVDRAFNQYGDYSKATRSLGWRPRIGIEEIVERVLKSDFVTSRLA